MDEPAAARPMRVVVSVNGQKFRVPCSRSGDSTVGWLKQDVASRYERHNQLASSTVKISELRGQDGSVLDSQVRYLQNLATLAARHASDTSGRTWSSKRAMRWRRSSVSWRTSARCNPAGRGATCRLRCTPSDTTPRPPDKPVRLDQLLPPRTANPVRMRTLLRPPRR